MRIRPKLLAGSILMCSWLVRSNATAYSNTFMHVGRTYVHDMLFDEKSALRNTVICLGVWAIPHVINFMRHGWKKRQVKRRKGVDPMSANLGNEIQSARDSNVNGTAYSGLDQRQFPYAQGNSQSRDLEQIASLVNGYDQDPQSRNEEIQQVEEETQYRPVKDKRLISWPLYLASFLPYSCVWYHARLLKGAVGFVSIATEPSLVRGFLGLSVTALLGLGINKLQECIPQFRVRPWRNGRLSLVVEPPSGDDRYRELGDNLLASSVYYGGLVALGFLAKKI